MMKFGFALTPDGDLMLEHPEFRYGVASGLVPDTWYRVSISVRCGADGVSMWLDDPRVLVEALDQRLKDQTK